MIEICKHCGWQIHIEQVHNFSAWVDTTDGDVCGWDGGNQPHEPVKSYKLNQLVIGA